MSKAELRINSKRLRADIETLAEIGHQENQGIYRMAFSDNDMTARRWFQQRIEDSGLAFYQDGAANLYARLGWNETIPAVISGSHLDTVPGAGHLDGALGVMCALEALRVIQESAILLKRPLEAVAFSDEEGRFGGLFGSQAVAGQVDQHYLQNACDLTGTSLTAAMARHGLDAQQALLARRRADQIHAYVELHIEQGPILDRKKISIGIVDAITGLFKWEISLHGMANHAGTTPMDMRADSLQGLADFAVQINPIIKQHGSPLSRATIGRASLTPGVANVIPADTVFTLDVRDTNPAVLEQLADAFRHTLAESAKRQGLSFELSVLSEVAPVQCSQSVIQAIQQSVDAAQVSAMHLSSGAAHDAQIIAAIAPVGMIFVPSLDGRSHSAKEWTDWEDIEAGANVLLNTLKRLAS